MPLLTAPFGRWRYDDAVKALSSLHPKDFERRHRYAVLKEHFSEEDWVGPGDPTENEKIEEQFAPDDAIGDVLYNVANAFREAQLTFTPLDEVQPGQEIPANVKRKIEEAKALVSAWWDRVRLHELTQERLYTSAWAGFAALRLWLPGRFMERGEGGAVTIADTDDFEEALDFIHLFAPSPSAGGVYTDPNTQDKVAIFFGAEMVEGETEPRKFVELVYLDPDRRRDKDAETVMRVVYENSGQTGYETRLKLGGRLLTAQMVTRALLNDAVLRTQAQLNLLTSLITRMAETAAFRGRYTQNAKPLGERRLYEDGMLIPAGAFLERDDEDRQWIVEPKARTLGAATTTELVGLETMNQEGQVTGHSMPGVILEDPVDPTPYINAAEGVRRRLLRMCSQGHLAGTSNFEVSGIAYEQARAVFEKDLNARRVAEEGMLRDGITSLLALTEWITNKTGYFTDVLRVVINQHVDPGPRSPDSIRLDHEAYEKGLISKPTAMSRIGVEDLEAEEALIRTTPEYIISLLEKAVPSVQALDEEALLELLRLMKLPEDLVTKFRRAEPVTPEPNEDEDDLPV